MSTDRRPPGAGAPARRGLPARVARNQWLIPVLLAAGGAVVLRVAAASGLHNQGEPLLIPVLACVPIVVLRRWPLPVLGTVTAATAMVAASGIASLPFGIMVGLALYFSALALPRPRAIALTLTVAVVLGAAVTYAAFAVRYTPVAVAFIVNLVPLGGAWFMADSVATRRRYEAGLAAQAERERAAEVREERVRIAREMHDVVAHALAVITVQAGVGRRLAGKRPGEAVSALGLIETIGRTAEDELRVVLGLLRDEAPGSAPLAPAPALIDVKDLAETVRAAGITVELRMEGTDRPLPPSLELSIYRVMQEALTNVVKHAPGARVAAELTVSAGKVRLDVRDDGALGRRPAGGAARAGPNPGAGHGITGMRERIGAFGGWLSAGPAAGGGFRVTAEVPVQGAAS